MKDNKIEFPPIEQLRISKEKALEMTIDARRKLFEKEKGKTYSKIFSEAEQGNFYLEYYYPENCNRNDILNFKEELIEQGFEVKFNSGMKDSLTITWYE